MLAIQPLLGSASGMTQTAKASAHASGWMDRSNTFQALNKHVPVKTCDNIHIYIYIMMSSFVIIDVSSS